MNLRAGGDPLDLFKRHRGTAGARRRRAHAVGDRAARLAAARGARHRRGQLDVSHAPSSRGRSTCRRSPGCATPARSSRRARCVAVDGATGEVFVDPDRRRRSSTCAARQQRRAAYEQSLDEYRRLPPVTADGVADPARGQHRDRRTMRARARERGAEGIGLFRSEFLLAGGGQAALTEEAQYAAYTPAVESMAPRPGHGPDVRRQRGAAAARSRAASTARARRSGCAACA